MDYYAAVIYNFSQGFQYRLGAVDKKAFQIELDLIQRWSLWKTGRWRSDQ